MRLPPRAPTEPFLFEDESSGPPSEKSLRDIGRTKSMPQLGTWLSNDQPSYLSALFLNEYVKSISAEYVVQIGLRGSSESHWGDVPLVDCVLEVNRDRLIHRALPKTPEKEAKGAAFVPSLLRSVREHLQNFTDSGQQQLLSSCLLSERRVQDVLKIELEDSKS